jgi:hypothetical protein
LSSCIAASAEVLSVGSCWFERCEFIR